MIVIDPSMEFVGKSRVRPLLKITLSGHEYPDKMIVIDPRMEFVGKSRVRPLLKITLSGH
jgi:hypothetical protein